MEDRPPRRTALGLLTDAFRTLGRLCRRGDKATNPKIRGHSRSDCSALLQDEGDFGILHNKKCRARGAAATTQTTQPFTPDMSIRTVSGLTRDLPTSSRGSRECLNTDIYGDENGVESLFSTKRPQSPNSTQAMYNFKIYEDDTATPSPSDARRVSTPIIVTTKPRSTSEELSIAYQELVDEIEGATDPYESQFLAAKADNSLHPNSAFLGREMPSRGASIGSSSLLSERSSATVERHPSKRNLTPITTIDTVLRDFEEALSNPSPTVSEEEKPLGVLCENTLRTQPARGNSHYLSVESDASTENRRRASGSGLRSHSSRSWNADPAPDIPGSPTLSQRILSSTGAERRSLLRNKSMASFKVSAKAFNLALPGIFDPVSMSVTGSNSQVESGDVGNATNADIQRTNSAKSVKHKSSMKRALRRIKTFTNLSVPYPPHSLKGKPLDELARLGGHSFFKLPYEYSPAPLQLPKCIAATCLYLLRFGIRVAGIYQEPGSKTCVSEIYNHYASPVLNAKRTEAEELTRSFDYPLESMKQAQSRGSLFAHDVCTAFQYFLYGLPGGIFGSRTLYEVLESINSHSFSHFGIHKDPGRGDYASQVSGPSAAKIRLLALALVALTDDLHLELICAVFGLLSLTVDECYLRNQVHEKIHVSHEKSCPQCDRLPNLGIVSRVIGGLLTEPTELADMKTIKEQSSSDGSGDSHGAAVAAMLIDAWKDVCLQLQSWDIFGL